MIQGGSGNDDIHLGYGGSGWTISDSVPLYTADGCAPSGATAILCPGEPGLSLMTITGGDGNDDVTVDPSVPASAHVRINGNAGNDDLVGGQGDDVLEAGENYNSPDDGNDTLEGNGGADVLYADPGADVLARRRRQRPAGQRGPGLPGQHLRRRPRRGHRLLRPLDHRRRSSNSAAAAARPAAAPPTRSSATTRASRAPTAPTR